MINYNNSEVRRQDRLICREEATELLENGEYGIMSMISSEEDEAYGIPLNFVWDKCDCIYIHCAPEGKKLNSIRKHPKVSFAVIGKTSVKPRKFTTAYESIVLKCRANDGLSKEEKMHALEIFMRKYSPNDIVTGRKYASKSFHRTEIIRLDIIEMSGKAKRIK